MQHKCNGKLSGKAQTFMWLISHALAITVHALDYIWTWCKPLIMILLPLSSAPTSCLSVIPLPTSSSPSATKPNSSTKSCQQRSLLQNLIQPNQLNLQTGKLTSPSLPPPPAIVPLQTIHLQIWLSGPSKLWSGYFTSGKIYWLMCSYTTCSCKKVVDCSDLDEADDKMTSPLADWRRIRLATTLFFGRILTDISKWKKNLVSEYYGTSDPFNSELAIFECQFFT